MIEMIREIFGHYGYQRLDGVENDFFKPKNANHKSYWLVVEISPDELLEIQGDIISKCQKALSETPVDKNTSMICLWKVSEIDDEVIRMVHKVEEDPYFFKKHVLYYTDKEKNSFSQEMKNTTLLNILQSAVDVDVFEKYKSDVYAESWRSLLYRLCIKLTFIAIEKVNFGDISDLAINLEKSFESSKNPDYVKCFDSIIMSLEYDNSDLDVEPEAILNDVLFKLEKDGYEI